MQLCRESSSGVRGGLCRREVCRRADHDHPHRPDHPNGDHVRGGPVFWTDPGIEPFRDDVARRRVGVDFELDIGKGR